MPRVSGWLLVILVHVSGAAIAAAQDGAMSGAPGIWFVYLHPEQPGDRAWRKRVVRLADRSVLEFFQRIWREAPEGGEGAQWLDRELGGWVYGLSSLLVARDRDGVAAPRDDDDLRDIVHRHLHVEGDPFDQVRYGEGVLRVLTDDDDYEMVYVFLSDDSLAEYPDELAFLVHDRASLPDVPGDRVSGTFDVPEDVFRIAPAGAGDGATFMICAPVEDTGWITGRLPPGMVAVVEGVRLPELAGWLRSATPRPADVGEYRWTWPLPWLLLRAAVRDDDGIERTLGRLATAPLHMLGSLYRGLERAMGAHADARSWFDGVVQTAAGDRAGPAATVDVGAHHAVLFAGGDVGPLVLFDDVWAAAHPNLARSMIGWARHWDPLDALHRRTATVIQEMTVGWTGWFGTWETLGEVAVDRPDAMCLDGEALWIAEGGRLSRFEFGARRVTATFDLGTPVAGLAAFEGRLFALPAEPTGPGTWAIREFVDGRLGALHVEVRDPVEDGEPAGTAFGLAISPEWYAVGVGTQRIVVQPRSGEPARAVDLRGAAFAGLSSVDGQLATRFEDRLLEIRVEAGSNLAAVAPTPLGDAPGALAVTDDAFVTLTGGELRRFRRRAPSSLVVTFGPLFAEGVDPAAATVADLRGFGHTVLGESFTDAALLRARLRAIADALAALTTSDGQAPDRHAFVVRDARGFADEFHGRWDAEMAAGRAALSAAGFEHDSVFDAKDVRSRWGTQVEWDPDLFKTDTSDASGERGRAPD